MYVSFPTLVTILEEICDQASSSPYDFKDQAIEEIFTKHKIEKVSDPRLFSIADLSRHSVGTMFSHFKLGKGKITAKKGTKQLYMSFESGTFPLVKTSESFLCQHPMVCLGKEDD